MSIANQITRIQQDRNTIRNKLIELGLANGTDNLDALATAVDGIVDNGDITVTVKEGETYTIPAGYHSGSGTVSGVKGGGNYTLQSKTVTPTKVQQSITSDDGYYGLSDVVVAPIPDAYQDVTSVTAAAGDVLTGKTIVNSEGQIIAGSMPNNGAVTKSLDTTTTEYTIPGGYHSGTGKVSITTETKTATPTKSSQTITPTEGSVISKVTVNAIPDEYQDVTGVTATADKVLVGSTFVDAEGTEVDGTMADNTGFSGTLAANKLSVTIPAGYHDGTGTVSATTKERTVTPTKSEQPIYADTGEFLGMVRVKAIPDAYQDVTAVTATADTVLTGSVFVEADGDVVEGTMPNNGAISASLDTTTTSYTVPAGYTTGGTVSLITETKSVTPTKEAQTINPSEGKVLSKVSVAAIPDEYQDVTGVTATAATVLTGSTFVDASGAEVAGTMADNSGYTATLAHNKQNITIPAGYHDGNGLVKIVTEDKNITPTKSLQVITPVEGKVLGVVTVKAIPDEYQVVTGVTATADKVLVGSTFVDAEGTEVDGTMANNGDVTATIDGLTAMSVTIPAGYTTGGTVTLTNDIEEALAAI